MTADILPHLRAAIPLDFKLLCVDHMNALFSLGPPQDITLEIKNISRADLTLQGKLDDKVSPKEGAVVLAFRPGVLDVAVGQKFVVTQSDHADWNAIIQRQEDDLVDRLVLTPEVAQTLKPGQFVELSIKSVSALSSGGSRGTTVALECANVTQTGTQGLLGTIVTRRVDVLQQLPVALSQLDTLVAQREATMDSLADHQVKLGQMLEKVRDQEIVPLRAEIIGSDLVMADTPSSMNTKPTQIRLSPNATPSDASALGYAVIPKGATITVLSQDDGLKLSKAGPAGTVTGPARARDRKANAGFKLKKDVSFQREAGRHHAPDFVFDVTLNPNQGMWTTVNLVIAISDIHQKVPAHDENGVQKLDDAGAALYETKKIAGFSMRVPVRVGTVHPGPDGLDVRGALGLNGALTLDNAKTGTVAGDAPLRLFQDEGWNFTLPINPDTKTSRHRALRVGPSTGTKAGEIDAFSVTNVTTTIGSKTRQAPSDLTVAAGKGYQSAINMMGGRQSFQLRVNVDDYKGLRIGPKGTDSIYISESGKNVGIGTLSPNERLEVSGTAKATDVIATDKVEGATVKASSDLQAPSVLTIGNNKAIIHHGMTPKQGGLTKFAPSKESGLFIETVSSNESAGIFMNGETMTIWNPGDEDLLRIYDQYKIDSKQGWVKGTDKRPAAMLSLSKKGDLEVAGKLKTKSDAKVTGGLTVYKTATIWEGLDVHGNLELKGQPGRAAHSQTAGLWRNPHKESARYDGRVKNGGFQQIGTFLINWGNGVSEFDKDHGFKFRKAFKARTTPFLLISPSKTSHYYEIKKCNNTVFTVNRADNINGQDEIDWIAFGQA